MSSCLTMAERKVLRLRVLRALKRVWRAEWRGRVVNDAYFGMMNSRMIVMSKCVQST